MNHVLPRPPHRYRYGALNLQHNWTRPENIVEVDARTSALCRQLPRMLSFPGHLILSRTFSDRARCLHCTEHMGAAAARHLQCVVASECVVGGGTACD